MAAYEAGFPVSDGLCSGGRPDEQILCWRGTLAESAGRRDAVAGRSPASRRRAGIRSPASMDAAERRQRPAVEAVLDAGDPRSRSRRWHIGRRPARRRRLRIAARSRCRRRVAGGRSRSTRSRAKQSSSKRRAWASHRERAGDPDEFHVAESDASVTSARLGAKVRKKRLRRVVDATLSPEQSGARREPAEHRKTLRAPKARVVSRRQHYG